VLPDVHYCADPYQAAEDAEAILVVTEWDEFRQIDWQRLRGVVDRPLIFDGRNALDAKEIARHGFQYISIGRLTVASEARGPVEDALGSANVGKLNGIARAV
jgi:UDPglucose 6-dehydrogenase